MKKPLNLGHRGAPEAAPENTLPGFLKALEMGADGIELDVRLSSDGAVVVIHNATVDKTTDSSGAVNAKSLTQLQSLDAGAWFSPDFQGTSLPTLEEVIEAVDENCFINIEIKNGSLKDKGLEQKIAAIINKYNLHRRTVVSSFNPLSLLRLRKADKEIALGQLYFPMVPFLLFLSPVNLISPQALHPYYKLVTPAYMAQARAKGYRVNVWTVNTREDMERMLNLQVDGIVTDRPELLSALLKEKGLG